jgi:hypothetical protein
MNLTRQELERRTSNIELPTPINREQSSNIELRVFPKRTEANEFTAEYTEYTENEWRRRRTSTRMQGFDKGCNKFRDLEQSRTLGRSRRAEDRPALPSRELGNWRSSRREFGNVTK